MCSRVERLYRETEERCDRVPDPVHAEGSESSNRSFPGAGRRDTGTAISIFEDAETKEFPKRYCTQKFAFVRSLLRFVIERDAADLSDR